jgi:GrpB-like predicted nucleotidyltransferase (UPF0157 family)
MTKQPTEQRTSFQVRDVVHLESRRMFFLFGSIARWGGGVGVGERVVAPPGLDAPIAAVESVLLSAERHESEVGLGFRYADTAELERWMRLPLRGAEIVIVRPPYKPVIVVPYDPLWAESFAALERLWRAALGESAVDVHHVGSTAVPGLAAKPIVDVDVEIPSRAVLPEVVRRLATLGYRHGGDNGVPGRESFERDGAADVPRDGGGRHWPHHNLYVCASDCEELRRHLRFRDWLRAHPETAAEYGALKLRLAELHRYDRDSYIEGKTALVEAVLAAAGALS